MESTSFIGRRAETKIVRTRYPDQIPIITKIRPGSQLPDNLNGARFRAKADLIMSDFLKVVRKKMNLPRDRALVMFASDREMITGEQQLGEVYFKHADRDGFLYFWCYDQSCLGC